MSESPMARLYDDFRQCTKQIGDIKKTMEEFAPPRLEQECLEAWVCRSLVATKQTDRMLEAAIVNADMWRTIALHLASGTICLRWVSDQDVYVLRPGPHDTETRTASYADAASALAAYWDAPWRTA